MAILNSVAGLRKAILGPRPLDATAYMLQGNEHQSPSYGGHELDPFDYDPDLPSGDYHVFYLNSPSSTIPLPFRNNHSSPVIRWVNLRHPAEPQSENEANQEGFGDDKLLSDVGGNSATKPTTKTSPADDLQSKKFQREVESERFARDIAENRLLIGAKMRHAGEAVEMAVVNRAQRHELMQLSQFPTMMAQDINEERHQTHETLMKIRQHYEERELQFAERIRALESDRGSAPQSPWALLFSPAGIGLVKSLVDVVRGKSDPDTESTATMDPNVMLLQIARDAKKAEVAKLKKQVAASKKGGSAKKKKEPGRPVRRTSQRPTPVPNPNASKKGRAKK